MGQRGWKAWTGAACVLALLVCAGFFAGAAGAAEVSVTEVRTWSTPSNARVVIHLTGRAPFTYDRLRSPDRIYVDIQGVVLRLARKPGVVREEGLVKGVRIALNTPTVSRIVLDLRKIGTYRVFSLTAPNRIVVDIDAPAPRQKRNTAAASSRKTGPSPVILPRDKSSRRAAAKPLPKKTAPKEASPEPLEEMGLSKRFRRGLGRIVLDPGHGGRDPGAIGKTGIHEKWVVLDISKRLARLLRRDIRARVFLTRRRDVFIPLKERTTFANGRRADLFVSVHANSAPQRSLQGIETYLLSEATSKRALEVAARENGVRVEALNDLQIILADLRIRGQINRSVPLAESIQGALISHLSRRYSRIRDLGVKQAPFYVLLGARMPSALVEVGFLSNRMGERRLRSAKYRQALALSLSRGIRKFIQRTQLARQVD